MLQNISTAVGQKNTQALRGRVDKELQIYITIFVKSFFESKNVDVDVDVWFFVRFLTLCAYVLQNMCEAFTLGSRITMRASIMGV